MKTNILGTEYEIIYTNDFEKYPKLEEYEGYCDRSIRKIVIEDFVKDEMSVDDFKWYKNKVTKHEIIYAFLIESGLWENSIDAWAKNEEMTDWIALQFSKIYKVFKDLDILD